MGGRYLGRYLGKIDAQGVRIVTIVSKFVKSRSLGDRQSFVSGAAGQ